MSLRYYDESGKIVFKTPTADGRGERAPTLADAKKLGLFLSVSTVAKLGGDSSSLENWFKTEPIRVAGRARQWQLLRDDVDTWVSVTQAECATQMGKAATRGSLVHKMAEDYSKWRINNARSFSPTADLTPYALTLHRVFDEGKIEPCEDAIELPVFDPTTFTAGTLDLAAKKAFGKKNVLIDFKTQSFKSANPVNYFNYQLQVAAYSKARFGKPGWCAIIYLDTSKHGTENHSPRSSVILIPPKITKKLYKLYTLCAKIKYSALGWEGRGIL